MAFLRLWDKFPETQGLTQQIYSLGVCRPEVWNPRVGRAGLPPEALGWSLPHRLQLLVAPGVPCLHSSLCLYDHTAFSSVTCLYVSLIRTLVCLKAHLEDLGSSLHFNILNLICSAKTFAPNNHMLRELRHRYITFQRPPFNPLYSLIEKNSKSFM